jgi:hypothetical protein
MEEESSTPPDLLTNLQKLAQERTRIRDKIATAILSSQPADETLLPPNPFNDHEQIEQDQEQAGKRGETPVIEPERPQPTDERSPQPGQFSDLKQADKSSERNTVMQRSKSAGETLLIPSRRSSLTVKSGKSRYIVIGSGVLICLLLLSGTGIFWLLQPSQRVSTTPSQPTAARAAAQKTAPVPTSMPRVVTTATLTKRATPVASANISFEDGSVGGWYSSSQDGTIESIKNVATSQAKDGGHVLMVSYDSDDDHSYPCVGTSNLPATLKAGQTITASILKRKGTRVKANLYVVDQAGKWYTASAYTLVDSTDTWYPVTFSVPSNLKEPVTQVGIILFGDNAVVYIDNINWH